MSHTQGSYQAECFTPKKSLARTPPKNRRGAENVPQGVSSLTTRKQQQGNKDGGQRKTVDRTKRALKEKNACFNEENHEVHVYLQKMDWCTHAALPAQSSEIDLQLLA